MNIKDLLIEKVREKGIAEIILRYKEEMELCKLKQMKLELFDLQFSLSLPYFNDEELLEEIFKSNEILINYERNKYYINRAYHRIEEIKRDMDINGRIKILKDKIVKYDNNFC